MHNIIFPPSFSHFVYFHVFNSSFLVISKVTEKTMKNNVERRKKIFLSLNRGLNDEKFGERERWREKKIRKLPLFNLKGETFPGDFFFKL